MSSSISTSEVGRQFAIMLGAALSAFAITLAIGVTHFQSAVADQARLMNVRLVAERHRIAMIDAFIAANAQSDLPLVVVLGDSQSWGFRHRPERVFTAHLQAALPDVKVLNLSVVDGRIADQVAIIGLIKDRGIRPSLIVTSANLGQLKAPEFRRLTDSVLPFWTYLLSPLNVYRLGELFPPKDARETADMAYRRFQVPDRFLDSPQRVQEMARQVASMLEAAQDIADRVLFYMPPHATEDFGSYGYNRGLYHRQVRAMLEACKQSGASCTDLSAALPLGAFQDVVHLNRRGHVLLARKLQPEIVQLLSQPDR